MSHNYNVAWLCFFERRKWELVYQSICVGLPCGQTCTQFAAERDIGRTMLVFPGRRFWHCLPTSLDRGENRRFSHLTHGSKYQCKWPDYISCPDDTRGYRGLGCFISQVFTGLGHLYLRGMAWPRPFYNPPGQIIPPLYPHSDIKLYFSQGFISVRLPCCGWIIVIGLQNPCQLFTVLVNVRHHEHPSGKALW